MPRKIIKSNSTIVAVSNNTDAFSTSNIDLNLYSVVQNANYSVSFNRQPLKQVGTQALASRETFQQPDVQLNIAYIPEPRMENEIYGNFIKVSDFTRYTHFFSGTLSNNNNFYILTHPEQSKDGLSDITMDGSDHDFSGWDAVAFGNCYPVSYGLSYGIGQIPTASTSFICSNMKFESLTGASMESPAINLESGNNNQVGLQVFQFDGGVKNPQIVNPMDTGSSVQLENLQVGGQALSGIHFIQSLDLQVNLNRVSTYGLGSNFAYDRKALLPAEGNFSVSSLVSGVNDGDVTGLVSNDSSYDFDLVLESSGGSRLAYKIQGAKLDSYNYTMPVNGLMNYDASFNFEITETSGLSISGKSYS